MCSEDYTNKINRETRRSVRSNQSNETFFTLIIHHRGWHGGFLILPFSHHHLFFNTNYYVQTLEQYSLIR